MTSYTAALLFPFCLLVAEYAVAADYYKCVAENGSVSYSSNCPSGTTATPVTTRQSTADKLRDSRTGRLNRSSTLDLSGSSGTDGSSTSGTGGSFGSGSGGRSFSSTGTTDTSSGIKVIDISENPTTSYNHTVYTIRVDTSAGELTIAGANFGNGPNVILYDTFDNDSTGTNVALINPNNPTCSTDINGLNVAAGRGPVIGCWTSASANYPRYSEIAYSGSHSMQSWDNATGLLQIKKSFDNITEAFISHWVFVPQSADSFFPGAYWFREDGTVGGIEEAKNRVFPKDSSWKMNWLLQDGKYDTLFANLVLPSHIGYGIMSLGGNDNKLADIGKGDKWWSWDYWTRISTWIRANTVDPQGLGEFLFQAVSEDKGFYQASSTSVPIFDTDGPAEKYFNSINIPGWIREGSRTSPLYDDIYIAIGPGSVSRVEIGNQPTYYSSNRVAILRISAWSDTGIRALFDENTGFGAGIAGAYLYITDADGRVNETGYPLN